MEIVNKVGSSTGGPESTPAAAPIDRTAPAGAKNSLGAQSIRDGRPDTDDEVVEAIDEVGPAVTP
jgi:hypothetical protein